MDTASKMKSFNKTNPSQRPIFNAMETSSLRYKSFTQNRDASFSSYLRPQVVLDHPKPAASQEDHIGCTVVVDDSEISIFDAQKYFNESNVHDPKQSKTLSPPINNSNLDQHVAELSAVPRLSSVSSVDGYSASRNYRVRSFHATPTASSEASWNSQSGLLANPPGSIAVSLRNLPTTDHHHHHHHQKKRGSTSTKWFFGRKCPCSGKKSVQVEEVLSEPRSTCTPIGLDNNNSKAALYAKRQSPKSDERMVENIPSKSQKSSVTTNNSVERQEKVVIPNSQRLSSETENHFASNIAHHRVLGSGRPFSDGTGGFSFPILNPSSPVKLVLKGLPPQSSSSTPLEDPPRDSLEVFQPLEESIARKSMEVQQRMLASNGGGGGDRDRRAFTSPGSPISRVTPATDDDVASDASSDLFEIESFSTQTTSYPMYRRRDSLDEAPAFNARRLAAASNNGGIGSLYFRRSLDETMTPSIAPTECYEPSEASIDWSVTTAEGFDRASVTNFSMTASDIEDVAMIRHGSEKGGGAGCNGGGGEGGKRKGNGLLLLSCRHEKAVSVGPHPHPVKCLAESGGQPGGPPFPLVSTCRHVNSRPPKPNTPPPPLARSHSARFSLAFAT